uniref:Uncharacterized protein n=1 Tax=Romanomermis culicivorax TaxID=13658 RepID=A0A915HM06_ROMCU
MPGSPEPPGSYVFVSGSYVGAADGSRKSTLSGGKKKAKRKKERQREKERKKKTEKKKREREIWSLNQSTNLKKLHQPINLGVKQLTNWSVSDQQV